jgi:hypothetical protein
LAVFQLALLSLAMANVRDPAFWRRFSLAVHLDEEQNTTPDTQSASSTGSRLPIKRT